MLAQERATSRSMTRQVALAMVILTSMLCIRCHNTARGVKADTSRALEKTGQKIEKLGDKINDPDKKGSR
jgi:predicted small secreted protein